MVLLTESEFADHIERDRSWVRQLREAGRLAMVDGLIDADASEALIAATAAGRDDVAERHAESRSTGGEALSESAAASRKRKLDAEARRAELAVVREQMEVDRLSGSLLDKADVDHALDAFSAEVAAAFDAMPDQLATTLAGITDVDEAHRVLSEHCRNARLRLARREGKSDRPVAS